MNSEQLDKEFATFRDEFAIPTFKSMGISDSSEPVVYLCGNSLGLMPLQTRQRLNTELDAWSMRGVESHFRNPVSTDWVEVDLPLIGPMSEVIGCEQDEVAIMGSLTANLNALLVAFYKPDAHRNKILAEKHSFPSDRYAFSNILQLNGFSDAQLIEMEPRAHEFTLRTEDILETVRQNKHEIAMVVLPGIQYYTGQLFDIRDITMSIKAIDASIIVGWDLAHAVGNVPLQLHDWQADFATWCSYKYLNAGPGGISGIFINNSVLRNKGAHMPRLAGWWGNSAKARFTMLSQFEPEPGALGFRMSNPSVLDVVALRSSLDIFSRAGGVAKLREKSVKLTMFLQHLLEKSDYFVDIEEMHCADGSNKFTIITPTDIEHRGSQLSLLFVGNDADLMIKVFGYLNKNGIICDERKPNVIRIAPTALYNTFSDVEKAVAVLNDAFTSIASTIQ